MAGSDPERRAGLKSRSRPRGWGEVQIRLERTAGPESDGHSDGSKRRTNGQIWIVSEIEDGGHVSLKVKHHLNLQTRRALSGSTPTVGLTSWWVSLKALGPDDLGDLGQIVLTCSSLNFFMCKMQ